MMARYDRDSFITLEIESNGWKLSRVRLSNGSRMP
jgi:hypothetical protein